jgi:hypothetical protein
LEIRIKHNRKIKQVRCELRPKLIYLPRRPWGHQPLLSLRETPHCNNRANRTLVSNCTTNRWLTCLHSVRNAICGPHVVRAELCAFHAIFLQNQVHIVSNIRPHKIFCNAHPAKNWYRQEAITVHLFVSLFQMKNRWEYILMKLGAICTFRMSGWHDNNLCKTFMWN